MQPPPQLAADHHGSPDASLMIVMYFARMDVPRRYDLVKIVGAGEGANLVSEILEHRGC